MRAVACLVVAVMLFINTLDRVACPDGCTDEREPHATAPAGPAFDCSLCQGWSAPAIAVQAIPAALALGSVASPACAVRAPHLPGIDHPPKHA